MPNWCDTTYCCVGSRRALTPLKQTLDGLKSGRIKSDSDPMWLCSVVDALGGESEFIGCRGKILDYKLDMSGLWIYQETAWCEQEDFREFLEKLYPSIKIYYSEIEPMEDIYYTNDDTGKYFPTRYILDLDELGWEYFENLDDVVSYISKTLDIPLESIPITFDDLEEWLEERNDYYSIHKIEVV